MDQYRLLAGITAGRIDSDDLGSFEIEDGEITVEDYDTARSLVRHYNILGWEGDDPGPPDDDADDSDEAEAESESEDQELEAEPESEDESESESADESGEDENADADAEADAEAEEVERDDEGREIYTCAGMDGECTRRVDEPGGLCWQHED